MKGGYRVVQREWRFDTRRGEGSALWAELLPLVQDCVGRSISSGLYWGESYQKINV